MTQIEIVGQVITSTNYATDRIFNFNPEYIERAARHFAASGITKLEIPEGVLDPDNKTKGEGIDGAAVEKTVAVIPDGTSVVASYLGGGPVGTDNDAYLRQKKARIDGLIRFFPDMQFAMLHPPGKASDVSPQEVVGVWDELASYAAAAKPGFQLCLHNHYDSGCESAEQVRAFLACIRDANNPALRWGPDTGHCHGMGDAYLDVFSANADLIGEYFHIKARVAAFDKLHGGDAYRPGRDIWGNKAEVGTGLYSGFVNVADPEIETPFAQVFSLIREARKDADVVYGAMEIDIPRQHPLLEVMCATMYLRQAHGLTTAVDLTYQQIVRNVFGGGASS